MSEKEQEEAHANLLYSVIICRSSDFSAFRLKCRTQKIDEAVKDTLD